MVTQRSVCSQHRGMEPSQLILARRYSLLGHDVRSLARQAKTGELRRIRQGVYVRAVEWDVLKSWERYPLLVHAAAATLQSNTVFCRQSSAAIWGIPLLGCQTLVHACTFDGAGGRSRAGVRRHYVQRAYLRSEEVSGLLVTDRIRTSLDLAAYESFGQAMVVLDHILKPDKTRPLAAVSRDELENALEPSSQGSNGTAVYSGAAVRRIRAALAFADPASGSPGESLSRALMHQLGFQVPLLQTVVRDVNGLVAYCDFEWPGAGLVGEFDGLVKYRKAEYLSGRTPSETVIDEKRREDRIRATGRRVIRWTWAELVDSHRFSAFLASAGVPRAHRFWTDAAK